MLPAIVCIILGGSGSGKTTLLNTIAGRMNGPEVVTSGSIKCNGVKAKKFWNDGSVGYLQQYDFLMPFLTYVYQELKMGVGRTSEQGQCVRCCCCCCCCCYG